LVIGILAEKVKIPKSKAGLQRPLSERHAFLLIEKDNAWITSRNRELAETFCTLVTRGDPVTVVKTGRVIVWGIYAGEPQETGTIILDRKPDGRFKLVPRSGTPDRLLTRVAHLVGRPGSVTSEEGQHGLVSVANSESWRAHRDGGDGWEMDLRSQEPKHRPVDSRRSPGPMPLPPLGRKSP
jgi:hypothetical protein